MLSILGASSISVKFQDKNLKSAGIGRWGVNPHVLSKMTNGRTEENLKIFEEYGLQIFQRLLIKVIENAKKLEIDFLYATPVLDECELIAKFLEEEGDWLLMNKNVENITKLMGSKGVEIIKEKRGLNILEAQAAKLVARMSKDSIQSGEIRVISQDDMFKILEILNNYSNSNDMARIWTIKDLEEYLKLFKALRGKKFQSREEYSDTPFGTDIYVWDNKGAIDAVIIFELNETYLKNGFAPILFIHQLAFSNEIVNGEPKDAKQKKKEFLGSFLAPFHKKIATCYALLPYYDEKAFDGFLGERRTTRFLVKILSEKALMFKTEKKIKIKKFYLNYVGFTVP